MVQFTGNAHKREQVIVIVLTFVCEILFVSFTDEIIVLVIAERVPGEDRRGIQSGDACRRDRVRGLDVPVAVVDANDQEVVVSFHAIPPYIDLVFGAEIWLLSPASKSIIAFSRGLVDA